MESSRHARDKEWCNFMSDVQDRCSRIDDAYKKQEEEVRKQFEQLESQLAN